MIPANPLTQPKEPRAVKERPILFSAPMVRALLAGTKTQTRRVAPIIGQDAGVIAVDYRATYEHGDRLGDALGIRKRWAPVINMLREYSRILLEITEVRVQRLREISEADANREGCDLPAMDRQWSQCSRWFQSLWELINGAGSWGENSLVWAISFRRIKP